MTDTLILNYQQEEAKSRILDWLVDENDNRQYCLGGYAGTGKTTTIKCIIEQIISSNPAIKIAVSAPTHKAKSVLERVINQPKVIDSLTIQSLLGMRPNVTLENYSPKNPQFSILNKVRLLEYDLVVIDEASMINKDLIRLILKITAEGDTKILFLGDSAQLPPVGESISDIFVSDDIHRYQLTKIERQKEHSDLVKCLTHIRNNPKESYSLTSKCFSDTPNNAGDLTVSNRKEVLSESVIRSIIEGRTKVICWRNQTVENWNNEIVKRSGMKHSLKGHILVAYSMQEEFNVTNSVEYSVIAAVDQKTNLWYNNEKIEVDTIGCRIIATDANHHDDSFWVRILKRSSYAVVSPILFDLHNAATKSKDPLSRTINWKNYYKFKNNFMLMNSFESDGCVIPKDIDFAYAITVHKSQGSTYENVILDVSDIGRNDKNSEHGKLIYVGASRASVNLTIV